jgi:repressor LexA
MQQKLTERQNQAYEYICEYMRENGMPPTIQEIGKKLAIASTNGVFKLLKTLEQKGYITKEGKTARGLRLTQGASESFGSEVPALPLIGRASSEQPELLRKTTQMLHLDFRFLRRVNEEACLVGTVGDDGMNKEGIRKGDYIAIEERPKEGLENGMMVACLVRDQLKVRFYQFANGMTHLRPADRSYTEEIFPPQSPECYIIGRVITVMRRLI